MCFFPGVFYALTSSSEKFCNIKPWTPIKSKTISQHHFKKYRKKADIHLFKLLYAIHLYHNSLIASVFTFFISNVSFIIEFHM